MTIAVTGGAGFILLVDWLAGSQESVVNRAKLAYAGAIW
jgi:hypothetical protein